MNSHRITRGSVLCAIVRIGRSLIAGSNAKAERRPTVIWSDAPFRAALSTGLDAPRKRR